VTIAIIYVLLVVTFGSQSAALAVLLSLPVAFIGGAVALVLRGMHLNVSSGVGFAALFGVSIMNGVLMVRSITTLRIQGLPLDEAIIEAAEGRLRPIVMASLVAILGLLPASLATGPSVRTCSGPLRRSSCGASSARPSSRSMSFRSCTGSLPRRFARAQRSRMHSWREAERSRRREAWNEKVN
jgi:hypothetical protein